MVGKECALKGLTGTLKPLTATDHYGPTVIGILAVDGWTACYIWYSDEGPGRAVASPSPLLAVPNVTAHPSTASVSTS